MALESSTFNIFSGFTIKYPEYSVITPQTGYYFTLRSMTISEVNKIRSSSVSVSKVTEMMNRIIWDCIVVKPNFIKNYDDFINMVTMKDRESLLFGLFCVSFEKEQDNKCSCANCNTERLLRLNIEKIIKIEYYPGIDKLVNLYKIHLASGGDPDEVMNKYLGYSTSTKKSISKKKKLLEDMPEEMASSTPILDPKLNADILENIENRTDKDEEENVNNIKNQNVPPILRTQVDVKLPVCNHVVCTIRQPVLKDELNLLNELEFLDKDKMTTANETIFINCFKEYDEKGEKIVRTISKREDIYNGYVSLTPLDKKAIINKYVEEYGKYGISLSTNWTCMTCGASNEYNIDLLSTFFRMVYQT